jgi:hypothetical protein
MKAYLEAPFNDFKTGAQIAAPVFIDQYIKQRGKLAKMFSKQKDAEARLKEEFTSFYTNVQNYRTDFVLLEVFKAMKSYAEKINNSYQSFFASLEVSIKRIKTNIDTIYNKYDYQEGSAVRYVCAGKPSLDALKKQIVSTNSIYQLPGELCNDLYNSIRAFAFSDSDVKNDGYFVDMFDDTIMAFWKTRVMDDYGTLINVDIITALENEAEFEHGIIQKDAKEKYIMEIMEQSERLSAPFIESPLGEQPRIISACTYNPSIVTNGYAERSNIINQKLIGGVEDEAIEQNMIIFYRAIYGLRANDLSKFAPPLKEETLERGGGEYYRAYFDLIEKISPETHKSDYITPHIDKRWHLISELPDLDEENQLTQERMILKSVFLGLLFKKISYTPSSSKSNEFLYSLDIDKRVALVVSNGTPCDLLYEVFDALTIHPISVKEILKACELDLQKELIAKVEIDSSKLIKALTNFRLPEFTRERASMLELPLFYKRSAPALEYSQDTALTLLDVIFETIREYVTSYAEAADVDLEFVKVLEEQMELFDANISKLEKEIPGIRKEILVVDIYKETAKQFANLNREDLEEKYKSAVDL